MFDFEEEKFLQWSTKKIGDKLVEKEGISLVSLSFLEKDILEICKEYYRIEKEEKFLQWSTKKIGDKLVEKEGISLVSLSFLEKDILEICKEYYRIEKEEELV